MITDLQLRVTPETAAVGEKLMPELHKALDKAFEGRPTAGAGKINDWKITRRSIDARQKQVYVNLSVRVATDDDLALPSLHEPVAYRPLPEDACQAVVVGAGPAGLFAALRLIELGIRPIVLERGSDVDSRRITLARISREGIVDPDCNYCFGEGGAGAYSDGKLYTRSKKRGDTRHVLQVLVQHGASESILVDAHPHIGSDRLPDIIKAIRRTILECGGEVHFNTRVDGLIMKEGEVKGVTTTSGEKYTGPVILATGHSARDVYRFLHSSGVGLQAKGLAIGVRLEHPQEMIDRIMYHSREGRGKYLPAAEYSFTERSGERGVYSFCMCPGGIIVPSASGPQQSVVNGMSPSNRGSRWANSGMVVEVHPGDIPGYSQHGPLEMLELQESLERQFFTAAANTLKAPAQRMGDFVKKRISSSLPRSSYAPGLLSLPLHFLLPQFISERLADGFKKMGKKSRGFLTDEAVMIGLESRTSSPVRIPRDAESLQHISVPGLYPAGEGAGYAGGIVSAAIDGQRCADALANKSC